MTDTTRKLRVLEFFMGQVAKSEEPRLPVSPSRDVPYFDKLYGGVNRRFTGFDYLTPKSSDYDPKDDGPRAA